MNPLPYHVCLGISFATINFDRATMMTSWNYEEARKAESWCVENCKGQFNIDAGFDSVVYFELSEDAALFKLFWQ